MRSGCARERSTQLLRMSRPPVLIVIDDEPSILALIERIVRPAGFKTILHSRARDALAALPEERPDIALVDLQMPELGGLDVLREIRQVHPECGVILMTGHASVESAIEAGQLGAVVFLNQPRAVERLRRGLGDVKEGGTRRAALLTFEEGEGERLGMG